MLEREKRNLLNSGSLWMSFHLPVPCLRTPARRASSSSAVHFCFGFPIPPLSLSSYSIFVRGALSFRCAGPSTQNDVVSSDSRRLKTKYEAPPSTVAPSTGWCPGRNRTTGLCMREHGQPSDWPIEFGPSDHVLFWLFQFSSTTYSYLGIAPLLWHCTVCISELA